MVLKGRTLKDYKEPSNYFTKEMRKAGGLEDYAKKSGTGQSSKSNTSKTQSKKGK